MLHPENIDVSPTRLMANRAAPTLTLEISACANVIARKTALLKLFSSLFGFVSIDKSYFDNW